MTTFGHAFDISAFSPDVNRSARTKPHIIFITEKWCDGNPQCGPTTHEHLLFSTLELSNLASFERWHIDEFYLQHNVKLDRTLLHRCAAARPAAIVIAYLFGSSLNLEVDTLASLRKMGIPLVFVWCDLVFESFFQFVNEYASPFAAVNVVLDSPNRGRGDGVFLHLWTPRDPRIFNSSLGEKVIDVSFLGSIQGYPDRIAYIGALAQAGIPVLIAGGQRERRLTIHEYANIMKCSRICLNFSLAAGLNGVHQAKGRIFEVTACGGLLLDSYNDQTCRWFDLGTEYDAFRTADELASKVRFYLSNEDIRAQIAAAGNAKCRDHYGPMQFWKRIFDRLGFDTTINHFAGAG